MDAFDLHALPLQGTLQKFRIAAIKAGQGIMRPPRHNRFLLPSRSSGAFERSSHDDARYATSHGTFGLAHCMLLRSTSEMSSSSSASAVASTAAADSVAVVVVVVVVGQASALHSCQVLDSRLCSPNSPRVSRPSGLAYTVRNVLVVQCAARAVLKAAPLRAQGRERALGYSVLPAIPCLDDYSSISLPRNLAGPRLGQKLSKVQNQTHCEGKYQHLPGSAATAFRATAPCRPVRPFAVDLQIEELLLSLHLILVPRSMFFMSSSHTQAARERKQA